MKTFFHRSIKSLRTEKSFVIFGSTSVLVSVANLAAGVITLRWVTPEMMGLWQTSLLVMALCDFAKLGILNGMNREFPYRMGRGEVDLARRAVATASAYMVISMLVAAIVFLSLIIFYWSGGIPTRIALVAGGLTWCAAYYSSYVQATCRGSNEFTKLSQVQTFDACVALLTLVFVWRWGFYGLCLRAVLQMILSAAFLYSIRPVRVSPRFDVQQLRELLISGIPLFGASYLFVLGNNAERAVLLSRSDIGLLGLFAPIAAVQAAMLMLPNAALIYAYPKLSFAHGRQERPAELWAKALRVTISGMLVTALIALVGWLVAPWMVQKLFPAYAQSVVGMRWAVVAGVFLAARPMVAVLPVLRSWGWHYTWVAVFVAAKWGLCSYFVTRMDPIEGVAFGGLTAAGLTAGIMFIAVYCATHPL